MVSDPMRRQFLATSDRLGWRGSRPESFGDWWISAGSEARLEIAEPVCLVGLAADVTTGDPVDVHVLAAAYSSGGIKGLVEFCDRLAGRFLALVAQESDLAVIPDGWASLQAFWGVSPSVGVALSSSPGLLVEQGFGSVEHADEDRLRGGRRGRALEYRSVGDFCPVSGTWRVRPNQLLELPRGRQRRLPLRHRTADFDALTGELGNAIRGLQAAHRGETWLPITAGLDSRWVAWAAHRAGATIKHFTFIPDGKPTPDAEVGAAVADRLGANHASVPLPATVNRSVQEDVTAVRGAWRDLDKMAEIEYFASLPNRVLVLNGNGGEILRGGYYGLGPRPKGRRLLRSLCLGPRPSAFDREGFDQWFGSLDSAVATGNAELDELFYWEQRMSHWGSDFYAEKENYVDELSPYCCRRLLLTSPAVGGRRRAVPLAEALASVEQLAGVPVNPHERHGALRRLALVRSIVNRTRELVPDALGTDAWRTPRRRRPVLR